MKGRGTILICLTHICSRNLQDVIKLFNLSFFVYSIVYSIISTNYISQTFKGLDKLFNQNYLSKN